MQCLQEKQMTTKQRMPSIHKNAICLVTNDEEIEKNATKITEDVTCYKTDRSWDATHLL